MTRPTVFDVSVRRARLLTVQQRLRDQLGMVTRALDSLPNDQGAFADITDAELEEAIGEADLALTLGER